MMTRLLTAAKQICFLQRLFVIVAAVWLLPALSSAATYESASKTYADSCDNCFDDFVAGIIDLVALAIPILFGLSVLVTLFGASLLIANAGSEEKMKQGRQMLIWGIIFVVVSTGLWSIVFIIQDTFGLR